jgi:DNA repair photolyase
MIDEMWCKTALSPSKLPGLDYSLNPYSGCAHACKYCYVPNVLHLDRKKWGEVKAKINIPMVLRKELKSKRKGTVGISTVTDAYQPAEKEYELTRKCLSLLLKKDFPINIQTKSDMVLRDMDLIKKFSMAAVGITITTLDEMGAKMLEPGAPSVKRRLQTVKKLADDGIYAYIFFGPVFPDIEKSEVERYVQTFIDHGAEEIMIDSLHLKPGVWESVSSSLPEGKREVFGERLKANYYADIFSEIEKECRGKIALTKAFGY